MNTNKNSYIFIYASVMVVIVAFLLAFVSSSLKPIQQQKEDLDKKKQILASLNIFAADTTEAMYTKCVKEELLLDTLGNVIDTTGAFGVK